MTTMRLVLAPRPTLIAKVSPHFTKTVVAGTGISVSYTAPTYTISEDIAGLTNDPSILTTEIANIYTDIYNASTASYAKASLDVIRQAIVSGGGAGDVVGPSSSTDNAVARFDGATGLIIQNSGVIVDDADNVTGMGTLASAAHAVTSSSANALVVGQGGAVAPALHVDASAATSVTGIKITSKATAGGAFLAATGDVNTQLNIDAAGSGVIRLADTSTGAVEFGTNAVPQASDGAALGTTALMWSDAFLASGAVINFNAGDVTLTHAANTLTFAGATSGYQFTELIAPAANDGAPIGSAALQWSDLFLASGAVVNFANGDAVLTHSAGVLTVSTGDLRVTTAGTNAASVATLGGTQTLTSKTLTAPVLTGATAHGVLHANGTGVITSTAEMTDGQILIGATGADPVPRTVGTDATLSSLGALTIANDAVTYAKMQNISATSRILGRKTAAAGDVEECTLSEALDFIGSAAQGDILYRGAASWARLAAGTTGQFLKTNGGGGNPQWASLAGGGDLLAANNLNDVANAATAFNNIKQPASSTSTGVMLFLQNYLSGLTLSNNGGDPTNDVDIATGIAADSTNAVMIALTSSLTKRIDASWAVGTNQGGLDGTESVAGTPDIDTWYHVWLIRRSDAGVVDALFSESASAPIMPASYDQKRRIGAVYNNSAGNILAFTQTGDEFFLTTSILDADTAALTTARSTFTLTVPPGMLAHLRVVGSNAGAARIVVQRTAETDAGPSNTAAPLSTLSVQAAGAFDSKEMDIFVDASSQIAARASAASTTFRAVTRGWKDRRGRDG